MVKGAAVVRQKMCCAWKLSLRLSEGNQGCKESAPRERAAERASTRQRTRMAVSLLGTALGWICGTNPKQGSVVGCAEVGRPCSGAEPGPEIVLRKSKRRLLVEFRESREAWYKRLAEAETKYDGWGFDPATTPSGQALYDHLFAHEVVEWNRIGHFQDVTMRLIAERLLPGSSGKTYVTGELVSQQLQPLPPPTEPNAYHLFCSAHNPGAAELMAERSAPGTCSMEQCSLWPVGHCKWTVFVHMCTIRVLDRLSGRYFVV